MNKWKQRQPTTKELSSEDAIEAARCALQKQDEFVFGNSKLETEFMALGLLTVAERRSAVDDALAQISPKGRTGPRPPNNISAPPYGGRVLYAFTWKCPTHGPMYFKFCLTGVTGLDWLVLHSFHKD